MLSIFGSDTTAGIGIQRRELLRAGGLSLFGLALPNLLQASEQITTQGDSRPAKAKSIILFNLLGGPIQMDMFDMKPNAPVEIRGEFQPVSTSLLGLKICEHLPNVARWMHRATLIRTISTLTIRMIQCRS